MRDIDILINHYCPSGVEYKTIEDVASFRRGSFPQPYTNQLFYGGVDAMPFVQVADVSDDKFVLNETTKQTISIIAQSQSVFVPSGTVIVTLQGTIGRVAITQYDSYVDRTLAIFTSFKIKDINKKYFAYVLKHKFDFEKKFARGTTLKTITKEEFSQFEIPVPPLPVQEEIMRVLDTFTELQAELQKRLQQYNFYREKLLSFDGRNDVEWKTISSVAQVCRGVRVVKSQLSNEGYPVYQNCLTPMGYFSKTNCPGGTPFVICGGAAGNVGYTDVDCWAADDCEYIVSGQKISNRFIYHCLMVKKDYLSSKVRKASIPRLSPSVIKDLVIPVPSLTEQHKIVDILDRFDTLTNDLTAGLPAEIEKRRQQYEFYRDKLLTFKRKGA